jgi:hypothetical protein
MVILLRSMDYIATTEKQNKQNEHTDLARATPMNQIVRLKHYISRQRLVIYNVAQSVVEIM